MKNKLRASYSLLNSWDRKRYEECVLYYFRLKQFTSIQMANGKNYHKLWQEHINLTKTLPKEFGSLPLKDPQAELKLEVELGDWLSLVGVIDCYDTDTIYEFKTGVKNSSEYNDGMQTPVYGLLAKLSGLPVNCAKTYHYDQYKNLADQSMLWITKKNSKQALEWVKKNASEMHQYFESEGLYEKFGNRQPLNIESV